LNAVNWVLSTALLAFSSIGCGEGRRSLVVTTYAIRTHNPHRVSSSPFAKSTFSLKPGQKAFDFFNIAILVNLLVILGRNGQAAVMDRFRLPEKLPYSKKKLPKKVILSYVYLGFPVTHLVVGIH
jgi:hypothetical protein